MAGIFLFDRYTLQNFFSFDNSKITLNNIARLNLSVKGIGTIHALLGKQKSTKGPDEGLVYGPRSLK